MAGWVLSPLAEAELADAVMDMAERSNSRLVAEGVLADLLGVVDDLEVEQASPMPTEDVAKSVADAEAPAAVDGFRSDR